MKALILAAGLGSRLAPLTDNCPKSLVEVNGKSILIKQIENLYENNIEDITIISGYKADILESKIHDLYPKINTICSKDYQITNNMYSAYLAREILKNEDFLMMNADVFFDSSVISNLLKFEAPNAIVTDIGNYLEESMKVVEKGNRLVEISKQISPNDALGSSIDVYKFSKSASNTFFEKCKEYIEERKELKLWSEVAINDILDKERFEACPLVGRWVEIDNHEDLAIAQNLFKGE